MSKFAPGEERMMRPLKDVSLRNRIALISEHASPMADPGSVDSGGQNVYVAQVARHLVSLGFEVDVFTRKDAESLPEIQDWEDGVRVVHVPAGPPEFVPKEELLPYMQAFTGFMVDFFNKQPYDLIHANFWMSALVAADIKKALGIPFVVTFHALGRVRRIYQGKNDGFPDSRFTIEDRIVTEADRIIAECPQDEQDLLDLYAADPDKVVIIPCGFDPEEIWPVERARARRELGVPEDEWLVLQLGRIVPRKGIETAIRGFASMVRDHGVSARMMIVGGNSEDPDPKFTPEIGRLQSIAEEEGVSDRITFIGRRGRDDLKLYYSAANVFISTPWYEPFGITPIEAMACGTPVIGSNVGGIKFTVSDGKTGYLVPPKDAQALGERLAYLYRNPKKVEQFRKQAVKRANGWFTWAKVAASIADLYGEVLEEAQPVQVSARNLGDRASMIGSLAICTQMEADSQVNTDKQRKVVRRGFKTALKAMQKSQKVLEDSIVKVANAIINTLMAGGKVMVCGNGGSAADAQHFAAEFVGRFMYPERKGLPVMALTADTSFLTAWSNDVGYDQIFARQVETFGQPGDLLIAISTSGRSRNLIEAFNAAGERGVNRVALLGGDGGELLPMADIAIVVPSANSQRIQEVQILILHLLCELVEGHIISIPSWMAAVATPRSSAWDLQSGIPVQLSSTE